MQKGERGAKLYWGGTSLWGGNTEGGGHSQRQYLWGGVVTPNGQS